MKLVIVESPTKARTIGRFLGSDYTIKASMGHVMDLPKSTLGVDLEHNFEPLFEVVEDKQKIISDLKRSAKESDSIILATDPDREGEAIAAHVAELLQKTEDRRQKTDGRKTDKSDQTEHPSSVSSAIRNPSSAIRPLKRIVFHEITKEAIDNALLNPREINRNLVDAQTARRVLDRLVGYKLSPLLWRKVRRGFSAGRVQSVALRLIVEREREIEKFKKEGYWTINALLKKTSQHVILGIRQLAETPESLRDFHDKGDSGQARMTDGGIASSQASPDPRNDNNKKGTQFELIEINNEKIEITKTFDLYDGEYKVTKTTIEKELEAKKIVADLKTKIFVVSDILQKEIRRSPAPPYTTSTLQQDAARRLLLNGKRTMSLAQKLYEEGYITYHRTDSVTTSLSFQTNSRAFIKKEFGDKYIPDKPRFYATRQKLAQEAHEAIRPTAVGQVLSIKYKVLSITGEQGWRLYEMIWRRAVASQMSDAVVASTTVMVDTQSAVILGIRQLTETPESLRNLDDRGDSGQARMTKSKYRLKANGSVLVFEGFLKVNPLGLADTRLPQFIKNEKLNLIDVLEKEHETLPPPRYNDASIIKTLEEKGIGRPSTYATIVSTIESRSYVERGNPTTLRRGSGQAGSGRGFIPTMVGVAVNDFLVKNFSTIDDIPFTSDMEDSLDAIAHGEKQWVPMIKEFYLPFEKKLGEVEGAERVKIAVEETGELCRECGVGNLVVRTGRFGKFLACSTFPKCKFTKPFVEKTNLKCPKDGGDVIIKKTRKGRRFYGCSNYPKCDFAAWRMEDIKKHE